MNSFLGWPKHPSGTSRLSTLSRLLLLALALSPGSLLADSPGVDHQRIVDADAEPGNWLSHGRTYAEERRSPLRAIDTKNVDKLGLAWFFDLGEPRGLEATPLAVDGVLYFTGTWSVVYAVDGATGQRLWKYDPQVPRRVARQACCDVVNRGVAAWGGKIFVGTLDGRLIALDAGTGTPAWSVMTVDPEQPYTITGAPRVIQGKVIIGNGGAEFGVRGYVSAYSAETGERVWRFYTVPGNPAEGFETETVRRIAETWNGEWWKVGGGGTVWDAMAYDPELDLLYIGVGNGSPWNRRLRSPGGGDNLFLASIVALRPATGEYVWHYQVVPAETWDFTATQHMILADIEWQGSPRKVLMQAPKSGFFMIIDRETGEFLSAEPFAEVTWASHYDPVTGRPVENPGEDYAEGSVTVQPASVGAHNWQPMAYDPETGFVFIPTIESRFTYKGFDTLTVEKGLRNLGVDRRDNPPGDALFLSVLQKRLISGSLLAWNPRLQEPAWAVPYPLAWNGGVLATAGGLVFHGSGDGAFHAYRAEDGEELSPFPSQTGIIAASNTSPSWRAGAVPSASPRARSPPRAPPAGACSPSNSVDAPSSHPFRNLRPSPAPRHLWGFPTTWSITAPRSTQIIVPFVTERAWWRGGRFPIFAALRPEPTTTSRPSSAWEPWIAEACPALATSWTRTMSGRSRPSSSKRRTRIRPCATIRGGGVPSSAPSTNS